MNGRNSNETDKNHLRKLSEKISNIYKTHKCPWNVWHKQRKLIRILLKVCWLNLKIILKNKIWRTFFREMIYRQHTTCMKYGIHLTSKTIRSQRDFQVLNARASKVIITSNRTCSPVLQEKMVVIWGWLRMSEVLY